MRCQLKGSEQYCRTGRGICCASCGDHDECDRACLNEPGRCGYAAAEVFGQFVPVPRPKKTGR